MDLFEVMELVRLSSYAGVASALFYLAIDGHARGDQWWSFWAVHGIYYSAMLYLLVVGQFYPGYAYAQRDLLTVPLVLVLLACVREVWRRPPGFWVRFWYGLRWN